MKKLILLIMGFSIVSNVGAVSPEYWDKIRILQGKVRDLEAIERARSKAHEDAFFRGVGQFASRPRDFGLGNVVQLHGEARKQADQARAIEVVGGGVDRWWINRKINGPLSKFTIFEFKDLSPVEGGLMYAAYQKDIPLMREVLMEQEAMDFLDQPGVWKAVAKLHIGKETEAAISRLKTLLRFK